MAYPAIRDVRRLGFEVAIVTNQAAVARGILTVDEVVRTHRELLQHFSSRGIAILGVRFCPHHPDGVVPPYSSACACRKPGIGMLTQLAYRFDIDLRQSWMVGDNITDVQAGLAAGCRAALVLTGHGRQFVSKVPSNVAVINDVSALKTTIQNSMEKNLVRVDDTPFSIRQGER